MTFTPEEITAMATEAGLNSYRIAPGEAVAVWERFAALVAANEREKCAQVCELMRTVPPNGEPEDVERGFNVALKRSAAAIRARGTEEGV